MILHFKFYCFFVFSAWCLYRLIFLFVSDWSEFLFLSFFFVTMQMKKTKNLNWHKRTGIVQNVLKLNSIDRTNSSRAFSKQMWIICNRRGRVIGGWVVSRRKQWRQISAFFFIHYFVCLRLKRFLHSIRLHNLH